MPPWVDSISNSLPPRAEGVQPIPAFWLHPNKWPDGRVRSISGVRGSAPCGPVVRVRTSNSPGVSESNRFAFIADSRVVELSIRDASDPWDHAIDPTCMRCAFDLFIAHLLARGGHVQFVQFRPAKGNARRIL